MIGKRPEEGIGKGFRGVVTYLLQGARKEKDPHRVTFSAFRNLAFEKNELVARQMRLTASQSKRVKNPVYHFVIAWRPEEAPSDEVMIQVADRTCRELGLEEYQAYYVGHDDTDHRHMHIVVNRVHPVSFRAWSPHNDFARIEVSLDRQSEELGYERVPGRHSNRARALERQQKQLATSLTPEPGGNRLEELDLPPITRRRPRGSDYRKAWRERKPLPRQLLTDEQAKEIAERVATMFTVARSWDELANALAWEGATLERKGQGLILIHDNKTMKLSKLGKQVRYAELAKRFDETYDRYLERTSAGSTASEPRHRWQRPMDAEPERRPAPGNQPADDDAQGERGPGTARPPERPGTRGETSRLPPKQKGVARRRRLSRRRGPMHAGAAGAQDAMPTRPMGGEHRRLRSPRRVHTHEADEHPWGEGGRAPERASRRSRVATLRRGAARTSPGNSEPHRKHHTTEQPRQKRVPEPPRKRVSVPSRANEAPTPIPEEIDRLLEQAVAEVREERGPLDGIGVSLDDLFRHVSQSRSMFTVTKIDVVLALHRMGLVPKSHVEQAFDCLEQEKTDPLLPSLISEEPDREDDHEDDREI